MPLQLKGLKVFIASPGGLDAERKIFRNTLLEFNEDDAHERGVSFIPTGWEDTLAGVGRPQEIINEEVRKCDYMVLVLWDRWGTPPAAAGRYTSGTEEEYNVARKCLAAAGRPMRDIIVLFKGVDTRQLSDPGEQLRKVLSFKLKLETEKTLLYSTFDSLDEFKRDLHRYLLRWMRDEDAVEPRTPIAPAPPPTLPPRAAGPGAEDAEDAAKLLNLADELARQGRHAEAESLYAKAVVARTNLQAITKYARFLRRAGRLDHALAMNERLLELSGSLRDDSAQIEALAGIGIIRRHQGQSRTALRYFERAVGVAEELGEAGIGDLAFLLNNIGITLRKEGRFEEALSKHREALVIQEQLDDPKGLANAYDDIGVLLRQQGQLDDAAVMHLRALELYEKIGSKRGLAAARANLGEVFLSQGKSADAESEFQISLALDEELHNPYVGMNLWQLGRVALADNRLSDATEYADRALGVHQLSGSREGIAAVTHLLGKIALAKNELEEARELLEEAATAYEELDYRFGIAWSNLDLALAESRSGDPAAADRYRRVAAEADSLGHVDLLTAVAAAAEELGQF
jgi:tetratricopeptide (TPR) repeat protein